MTGTSFRRNRALGLSALLVAAGLCAGCPQARLSLDPELAAAARLKGAAALKAAAWLLSPGHMRVNIEPDPEVEGSCGVSLYIREADPEHSKLEIRCPDTTGKGLPGEAGAMGSLFEKTGSSVLAWPCGFVAENLDFSPGDEIENSGCFSAETPEKKAFKGCFFATGLSVAQAPKRLKPIIK